MTESASEDALAKAEDLLERLETTRAELERLAQAEDSEAAIAVLQELAQLAKDVEAELGRARRQADARG